MVNPNLRADMTVTPENLTIGPGELKYRPPVNLNLLLLDQARADREVLKNQLDELEIVHNAALYDLADTQSKLSNAFAEASFYKETRDDLAAANNELQETVKDLRAKLGVKLEAAPYSGLLRALLGTLISHRAARLLIEYFQEPGKSVVGIRSDDKSTGIFLHRKDCGECTPEDYGQCGDDGEQRYILDSAELDYIKLLAEERLAEPEKSDEEEIFFDRRPETLLGFAMPVLTGLTQLRKMIQAARESGPAGETEPQDEAEVEIEDEEVTQPELSAGGHEPASDPAL